jgi:tripartite-type tricarboxylate transporter receptor subunit TctC
MLRIALLHLAPRAGAVRIVVGFPPAGGTDIFARLLGQWLSERFVENRPGAAGNIATEAVVRAPADGYTLLMITSANLINATLYDKLSFNFIRDIAPVASIDLVPHVMAVNPSVPARTVPEFIAYAKANPGKINMASGGNGTSHYFRRVVQYDGRRQHATCPLSRCRPRAQRSARRTGPGHVRHRVRLYRAYHGRDVARIAVTTATRTPALPDIPTVGDFVPGYESSTLHGIGAPRNTPAAVIDKLNKEINAVLAQANFTARLAELGGDALLGSPANFAKLIAEDTEKWAKVIRAANIKPK